MKKFNFILFIVLSSCSADHEVDLIDQPPIETTITYNEHIKPIISNNCISCHSDPPINGAPIPLTTYTFVKNAVINNQLIKRIKSQDPGFRMPLGGPSLPQNLIELIEEWEADGLLEN